MFVETCPAGNPDQHRGQLCAPCGADDEQWRDEQTRAAAAFAALDAAQYERWLDEQNAEHAARCDAGMYRPTDAS